MWVLFAPVSSLISMSGPHPAGAAVFARRSDLYLALRKLLHRVVASQAQVHALAFRRLPGSRGR
jgi:hypothetical protein